MSLSTERKITQRIASSAEMSRRVARFGALKSSASGLPDMRHPEGARTLMNVIGFRAPDDGGKVHSPVGSDAAAAAAIPIDEKAIAR